MHFRLYAKIFCHHEGWIVFLSRRKLVFQTWNEILLVFKYISSKQPWISVVYQHCFKFKQDCYDTKIRQRNKENTARKVKVSPNLQLSRFRCVRRDSNMEIYTSSFHLISIKWNLQLEFPIVSNGGNWGFKFLSRRFPRWKFPLNFQLWIFRRVLPDFDMNMYTASFRSWCCSRINVQGYIWYNIISMHSTFKRFLLLLRNSNRVS